MEINGEPIQCEACGADNRYVCNTCHQEKISELDIQSINETGECLSCENHRGEALINEI